MCGRFAVAVTDPVLIQQAFALSAPPDGLTPRYNVAPSQEVAVVALGRDGENQFGMMRWGLIPSWSKDPAIGSKMINARGETVHEKPSFRTAFKRRRCLVLATGFYEWQKREGVKTPMYINMEDGGPFGMAGLWERWTEPESGETLTTCTIITTKPNTLMESIHNRMPVILNPADYAEWLDAPGTDPESVRRLLAPFPAERMQAYAVSTRVNNPSNEGADLIEKVPEA